MVRGEGWGRRQRAREWHLEREEGIGVERLEWKGPKGRKAFVMYINLSVLFAQNDIFWYHPPHNNVLRFCWNGNYFVSHSHNKADYLMVLSERGRGWKIVGWWPLTAEQREKKDSGAVRGRSLCFTPLLKFGALPEVLYKCEEYFQSPGDLKCWNSGQKKKS